MQSKQLGYIVNQCKVDENCETISYHKDKGKLIAAHKPLSGLTLAETSYLKMQSLLISEYKDQR